MQIAQRDKRRPRQFIETSREGFPYRPVRLHAFHMMIEYETNERKPKRKD